MKPIIKTIISPDLADLDSYVPEEPDHFGFHLQLLIGPESEPGEESFEITVCSPRWLSTHYDNEAIILGAYHIIMMRYDYRRLMERIYSLVAHCESDNWSKIALKLARFSRWEFEDYVP